MVNEQHDRTYTTGWPKRSSLRDTQEMGWEQWFMESMVIRGGGRGVAGVGTNGGWKGAGSGSRWGCVNEGMI